MNQQNCEIGEAFLHEASNTLDNSLAKIRNCLGQLRDEDVWWRQFESHNSIQNIILHLCGNLRQWIIHAIGGAPDVRDRPSEFSDRRPIAKSDLLAKLETAVADARSALLAFPPARLTESRRIQGFDSNLLSAIFDSVSHFVGHTHQIVFITRLRLGNNYKFQWKPKGIEQGEPA